MSTSEIRLKDDWTAFQHQDMYKDVCFSISRIEVNNIYSFI